MPHSRCNNSVPKSGADLVAHPSPTAFGYCAFHPCGGRFCTLADQPRLRRRRSALAGRPGRCRPRWRRHARLRQGAGDGHRICLDDLPPLRAFLGDDVPRIAEALHRHRQGPLHAARLPARRARRRRLHAGALRRQRQIHADGRNPVRQTGRLGGQGTAAAAQGNRQAVRHDRGQFQRTAWRIRRCSTASRRCATTPSTSSG